MTLECHHRTPRGRVSEQQRDDNGGIHTASPACITSTGFQMDTSHITSTISRQTGTSTIFKRNKTCIHNLYAGYGISDANKCKSLPTTDRSKASYQSEAILSPSCPSSFRPLPPPPHRQREGTPHRAWWATRSSTPDQAPRGSSRTNE